MVASALQKALFCHFNTSLAHTNGTPNTTEIFSVTIKKTGPRSPCYHAIFRTINEQGHALTTEKAFEDLYCICEIVPVLITPSVKRISLRLTSRNDFLARF